MAINKTEATTADPYVAVDIQAPLIFMRPQDSKPYF
jgi:hypothetical protein